VVKVRHLLGRSPVGHSTFPFILLLCPFSIFVIFLSLFPTHTTPIMERAIERDDPSDLEKKIDSEKSSITGRTRSEIEDVNSRLWLSEDEAYQHAKAHPDETREIFITFSPSDKDNPRNWSKAQKWYITCFASSLNVLTCLCAGGYSSGVGQLVEEFGVSDEVGTVGLSMYILGFAIGYVDTDTAVLDSHV
jgi:hypothetical protein